MFIGTFLAVYIAPLVPVLTFARAGGGGSGGGGGGGGALLVTAIPAYIMSAWLYKRYNRQIAIIGGMLFAVLIGVPWFFAGGFIGIMMLGSAIVGAWLGLNNLLGKVMKRAARAKKQLNISASVDPVWQEESLKKHVEQVFYLYQHDWSHFDLQSIHSYVTDRYYQHNYLMLSAMHQMGRRNYVATPGIEKIIITDVADNVDDRQDAFTAYIEAYAKDQQMDTVAGKILFEDNNSFQEFWHFKRYGHKWLLDGITQAVESTYLGDTTPQKNQSLEDFALKNNMFYSLDWGRLLLPQRGQLFRGAKFKSSNVDNHVIGEWTGQIVQLYTYTPAISNQHDVYLIGQITLPKSYGGIIIERRTFMSGITQACKRLIGRRRGYTKMSFEWPDFNKHYTVYATDMERVTSFELLNPSFMARLYDLDLPINIEVVDNVVYFYCHVDKVRSTHNYQDMLNVLIWSYHELRK